MPSVDRIIWNKLGIKRGDILPFTGAPWNMNTTRVTLAEIMAGAGYKIGAEIGVERGKYSRVLCDVIPGVKIFCVDPWRAFGRNSIEKEEVNYQKALAYLSGCNVEIMRMTSLEASQKISDSSLDFVYIDALHDFDSVMMDIILWSPKVRVGGIISGHDYVNYYNTGVIQAVTSYTQSHNILRWYVTTGEKEPSWLWVKP